MMKTDLVNGVKTRLFTSFFNGRNNRAHTGTFRFDALGYIC